MMDYIIIFKLLATPAAILICIGLSKRWGAYAGGLFGGLPTLSGPISFFITLEQGPDFSIAASYNSLFGLAACAATAVIYPWMAYFGFSWFWALICSVCGYFALGYLLHQLPYNLPLAVLLGVLAAPVVTVCLPRIKNIEHLQKPRPRWLVAFQLLCGAAMVYSVSEAARFMGPEWSGTIMCFPIMICALAPFAHASGGPAAALLVIKGLLTGWIGCVAFVCVVIFCVKHMHIAAVYFLAVLAAITMSVLISCVFPQIKRKFISAFIFC